MSIHRPLEHQSNIQRKGIKRIFPPCANRNVRAVRPLTIFSTLRQQERKGCPTPHDQELYAAFYPRLVLLHPPLLPATRARGRRLQVVELHVRILPVLHRQHLGLFPAVVRRRRGRRVGYAPQRSFRLTGQVAAEFGEACEAATDHAAGDFCQAICVGRKCMSAFRGRIGGKTKGREG